MLSDLTPIFLGAGTIQDKSKGMASQIILEEKSFN